MQTVHYAQETKSNYVQDDRVNPLTIPRPEEKQSVTHEEMQKPAVTVKRDSKCSSFALQLHEGSLAPFFTRGS